MHVGYEAITGESAPATLRLGNGYRYLSYSVQLVQEC
jgi:hypothetical protein